MRKMLLTRKIKKKNVILFHGTTTGNRDVAAESMLISGNIDVSPLKVLKDN